MTIKATERKIHGKVSVSGCQQDHSYPHLANDTTGKCFCTLVKSNRTAYNRNENPQFQVKRTRVTLVLFIYSFQNAIMYLLIHYYFILLEII